MRHRISSYQYLGECKTYATKLLQINLGCSLNRKESALSDGLALRSFKFQAQLSLMKSRTSNSTRGTFSMKMQNQAKLCQRTPSPASPGKVCTYTRWGPYISFPHNFGQKYFIKSSTFSESARRDLSKEPIKGWGLCKSALDLIMSSRSGP